MKSKKARYLVEVTPRLHSHFVLAVFAGMVAAFQSERWPFSQRIGGRFPAGTLAVFVRNTHLRLLADKVVELNYIDSISHEAIRRILKKTNSNLGNAKDG